MVTFPCIVYLFYLGCWTIAPLFWQCSPIFSIFALNEGTEGSCPTPHSRPFSQALILSNGKVIKIIYFRKGAYVLLKSYGSYVIGWKFNAMEFYSFKVSLVLTTLNKFSIIMHYLIAYPFEDLIKRLLFGLICMTALTIFIYLTALVGSLYLLFLVLLALGNFSQLAFKPHRIINKNFDIGLLLFRLLELLFLEAI